MKKLLLVPIVLLLLIAFINSHHQASFKDIESGFVTPPDSIQTGVYWYWISDNISKEGVVADLHAMRKAGINRAFIGNIGLDDVPYGKVKMLSEEWWSIIHAALKTATELNIEIGIFNSPGWSQSGGPWVSSKEAMRYLTSSELRVRGPQKLSQKLDQPHEMFQDVKLVAYPAPASDLVSINSSNSRISSSPAMDSLNTIVDHDPKTGINLPMGKDIILDFATAEPFTARSLAYRITEKPVSTSVILQARQSDGSFRTLREFQVERSNTALNVGFDPFAPVVISFPEATSNLFRVIIKGTKTASGVAEINISSAARVERYAEKTLAKMHPTPLPYWKEYQWPQQPEPSGKTAVIDGSRVIDLSSKLSADGTLNWNVPAGDWVILRTGMTPTGTKNSPASPEATGFEVDKMSRKHVEMHFYGHMGEFLKRIPAADRKTFKMVVQDSYEMGGQNFTDGFLQEFKTRFGYDALPFLPVYKGYVVNSQKDSDRFLWDMRRMVADKVAYDYVGGLKAVSNKHGLKTWLENYGHWGFPSEFLMYGGQSDEIGGEFWSEGELGDIENRAATSCGHIYGKTKISAESNTCAGAPFSRYPATIKQRGDRFFAEGINSTVLHVYITQPYEDKSPGMNAWFGNEFNRKNTWFSQMDVYTTYLKRVNFMLQLGLNVADVAYFIGEDAPKMTGITDPALPTGYQFDYMNAEVIEKYMSVRDGLITLPHGTQYRVLVLPKLETMRPELLRKIRQLILDGAVVLGPAPLRSPSLQHQPAADQEVKKMAAEIWGEVDGVKVKSRQFGKGMILNGMTMKDVFARINLVEDCRLPEDKSIHYGHRSVGAGDIYFISNQTDKVQHVTPVFRVQGMQPERWDATTGTIRKLPAFTQAGSTTSVPLTLEPYESAFIVFREKGSPQSSVGSNDPQPQLLADLNGAWTVQFDAAQRGPDKPVVFESLQDWSKSTDERIRYYSGTAVYSRTFNIRQLPAGQRVVIGLGAVTAMARVTVNGKDAGGVWTAPYRLDITKLVKAGDNDIRVEVVNTWVNRLIGDQRLPVEQRKTWCPVNSYKADSPLQPSGLFGPVQISAMAY